MIKITSDDSDNLFKNIMGEKVVKNKVTAYELIEEKEE